MTIGPPPLCYTCARARALGNEWRCEAYPERIPFEIIAWLHDHHKPFDGDNGLQYIPKREEEK